MENNFAHLEERVLKAVGLIQDLRTENTQLQERARRLASVGGVVILNCVKKNLACFLHGIF